MQKKTRFPILILLTVLSVNLASCTAPNALSSDDILTQKIPDPNRIPVTVLVKNAFTIHTFEEKAEQLFPELDIIQIGNHTSDMGIAEYEARLKHDDLADIVMTWPLHVGDQYWEDRLLDLSSLPCSGRYNTAHMDRTSHNGKLYYLPGPSQIRAIVYNKTMFQENGWTVPADFDGFLALCQEIEQSGIRSLQLGLKNEEVLDTAFVGYQLSSHFTTPADVQWLSDYNDGKGSFASHFTSALNNFQILIDHQVLQPADLKIDYAKREYMLFNRECAMVEDSVLLARMGMDYNGCTDEFGLMPFFNPGSNGDWVRLYPVCYIGLNKHLAEPENQKKYDLILQLMDYISSPDGQLALSGDTGAMFSALNGMPPPDIAEITDLLPALKHGRYCIFPVLKNAQGALRSGLAGMVAGQLSAAEVADMVDQQNTSPPLPVAPPVLGKATADFSMIETGNFITDAMREESNCEIALFLDNGKDGTYNGKGVSAKFYSGDITSIDLDRILPDLRQDETGELWKVSMTGDDLIHTLEYAISVDHHHTGWFYYFSGLRMEYDPTAPPGTRIRSITDANGQKIDPSRLYSIAVMDDSVPNDVIISCEKTGILIRDILKNALSNGAISPSGDGRFTVVTIK